MGQAFSYWQINAFTGCVDGGNPAGVMLLEEYLPDEMLARLAAQIALPATAFLVRGDAKDRAWDICWFSPDSEIRLCGHASLASVHVILSREDTEAVEFRTRHAGMLEARRDAEGYALRLPAIASEPAQLPEAIRLIGAEPQEVFRSQLGYNLFVYRTEAELRALTPDLAGLAQLGTDQFTVTAPGEESDIVSRVFTAGKEDSVTGSAHAVLAPYWSRRLNRQSLCAHQASERGGDLSLRMDGEYVWIGGECLSVAQCSVELV